MPRYIDADNADVERISCFYGSECRIEDVKEWLDEQPTADVAKVDHGHWIYFRDQNGFKGCKCSECLTSYGCIDTPYCPNCGAIMDGGLENEETI